MPADILEVAQSYARLGLSIIPIKPDGTKSPALDSWKPYQDHRASDEELRAWFGNGHAYGIAVICGAVSGNLEVWDFDSSEAWEQFYGTYGPTLEEAGAAIARTPSGGAHVYLFRKEAGPNRKIARTEDGKKTLIEVRGEGGYALMPGSPVECHPSGKSYEWLRPLKGPAHG